MSWVRESLSGAGSHGTSILRTALFAAPGPKTTPLCHALKPCLELETPSPHLTASIPTCGSRKTNLTDPQLPTLVQEHDFAELFSGVAALATEFRQAGYQAAAVDKVYGPGMDILKSSGFGRHDRRFLGGKGVSLFFFRLGFV